MKEYNVLLCDDSRICFVGSDGVVVDPLEVLRGGCVIVDHTTEMEYPTAYKQGLGAEEMVFCLYSTRTFYVVKE